MMTTRSASRTDGAPAPDAPGPTRDGRGLCFWYQATGLAAASSSCRYRIGHHVEILRGATTVIGRRLADATLRDATTLIVARPFVDRSCRATLERGRARGVRLVADFDDLLFAGDPAAYPLVLGGRMTERESAERIAGYREGLRCFDAFTASTEPLCDALQAAVPEADVTWVPNGLSRSWVTQGRALYPRWKPGDRRVLRFFSGSPSHDADFGTVAHALDWFLRAHPEVDLELVGKVEVGAALLPPERVLRHPPVPFMELPRLLASSWATIAPLAASEFNACKSAIKFLEAAAFGAPCVASPIADMARQEGVLLAADEAGWVRALESLLDDEQRMRVGERAMRWVDAHGLADEGTERLLAKSNGALS